MRLDAPDAHFVVADILPFPFPLPGVGAAFPLPSVDAAFPLPGVGCPCLLAGVDGPFLVPGVAPPDVNLNFAAISPEPPLALFDFVSPPLPSFGGSPPLVAVCGPFPPLAVGVPPLAVGVPPLLPPLALLAVGVCPLLLDVAGTALVDVEGPALVGGMTFQNSSSDSCASSSSCASSCTRSSVASPSDSPSSPRRRNSTLTRCRGLPTKRVPSQLDLCGYQKVRRG